MVTGQLADTPTRGLPTRGLDISWTGQVADWTTRGLADATKKTKTKHAKSPVASASCPVTPAIGLCLPSASRLRIEVRERIRRRSAHLHDACLSKHATYDGGWRGPSALESSRQRGAARRDMTASTENAASASARIRLHGPEIAEPHKNDVVTQLDSICR